MTTDYCLPHAGVITRCFEVGKLDVFDGKRFFARYRAVTSWRFGLIQLARNRVFDQVQFPLFDDEAYSVDRLLAQRPGEHSQLEAGHDGVVEVAVSADRVFEQRRLFLNLDRRPDREPVVVDVLVEENVRPVAAGPERPNTLDGVGPFARAGRLERDFEVTLQLL